MTIRPAVALRTPSASLMRHRVWLLAALAAASWLGGAAARRVRVIVRA